MSKKKVSGQKKVFFQWWNFLGASPARSDFSASDYGFHGGCGAVWNWFLADIVRENGLALDYQAIQTPRTRRLTLLGG